jgi:hypothetical protein
LDHNEAVARIERLFNPDGYPLDDGCQRRPRTHQRPYCGNADAVLKTARTIFQRIERIAVCRVKESTIEILHIWHRAQDWP